jgi:hypothetical protein
MKQFFKSSVALIAFSALACPAIVATTDQNFLQPRSLRDSVDL